MGSLNIERWCKILVKKITKKILFISDDFEGFVDYGKITAEQHLRDKISHGEYYSFDNNYLKFDVDLAEKFSEVTIKKYDAVLVDYGLIGNKHTENAIEILMDLHNTGAKLAWCGAMSECYSKDARKIFPKRKFLHNLPACSICGDDILWLLYCLFPKDGVC